MHRTIFDSNEAIEHYYQLIEKTTGEWPVPPHRITALDAFLMHQFLTYYPIAPVVIDCAAAATWGTSTIFCLDNADIVSQVITAPLPANYNTFPASPFRWKDYIDQLQALAGQPNGYHTLPPQQDVTSAEGNATIREHIPANLPYIFLITLPDEPNTLYELISELTNKYPKATFIVSPIYNSHESHHLASLIKLREQQQYSFRIMRELSPFLANSEIAFVHQAEDATFAAIYQRISQTFEGNFDFLPLLEANLVLQQSNLQYKTKLEQHRHVIMELEKKGAKGSGPSVQQARSIPLRVYQTALPLSLRRRLQIRNRIIGFYRRIVPQSVRTRWWNARNRNKD